MNDTALFEATVPVFRHYLQRIETLLTELPDEQEALLQVRLADLAFSASEHLRTAVGFASRTVVPLTDRAMLETDGVEASRDGLILMTREIREQLAAVSADDFGGATGRIIRHVAGTAELSQDATTFVTMFMLPNFFFHFGMAFAILRQGGADIGKEDFDGQHRYGAGFHFRVR